MADRIFHPTSPSFYQGKFSTPKANRLSYHNSNKQRLFGESKSQRPSPANSFFHLNEFDPVQTIHKAVAVVGMETNYQDEPHFLYSEPNPQYLHSIAPPDRELLEKQMECHTHSRTSIILTKWDQR